ncbi:little elongation complex subunit 2 isoform X2 [Elgaria multicarinata webbii]|uniref:little elongation complex subunit 2 isoform X2 n=1 Tax=Elgaria multicarinata webbii TaxID=159646 RepID=UPI002FCD1BC4
MAAAAQLLSWDIPPQNGCDVYFSRDIYEKYSLTPSLSELLLKRPVEDVSNSGQGNKTSSEEAAVKSDRVIVKPSAENAPFQDHRVAYTYFSSLTAKEQRRYLFLLSTYLNADPNLIDLSEQKDYSQYLQMKEFLSKEVAEFLKFAQNAARSCTKDYDGISEEALLYTKGKVNLIKRYFPKLPASIQLPVNSRKNESGSVTPEQRASMLHNDVSTDPNAEKLAVKYCPQVVLTSESLFTLLNNHGLDYRQQWELPISVKIFSVEGLKPVKVVFVDPPLPKKEMTVREKNQVFHEFLADFHMTKQSYVLAHAAILDKPPEESLETALEICQGRQMQVSDSVDLDFDTDVTELETFGSSYKFLNASEPERTSAKLASSSKTLSEHLKMEKESVWDVSRGVGEENGKASEQRQNFNKTPPLSGVLGLDCKKNSSVQDFKSVDMEADGREENLDKILLGSSDKNNNFKEGTDVAQDDKSAVLSHCSDNDEESLIIDTECKNTDNFEPGVIASDQGPQADAPESPCSRHALSGKLADPSEIPGQEMNVSPKSCQRLSKKLDPVGQILKMQTELLKTPSPKRPGQPQMRSVRSLSPKASQEYPQPKTSVPSTLEPRQSTCADSSGLFKFTWTTNFQGSQKGVLWDAAEDRSEYASPQQGNLVYKLFRLNDTLLLVRCPVQKAELKPRNKKAKVKRHFPVYVLPKLEYQAIYGAEALTEGEICRLWTESLLHSNSSFAVGHIDALTSKLFLLEQLSAEGLKKRFGTFKPANSLNILQHILKKVTGLPEGSYLLAHAAGDSSVTVYKSSHGKATRAMYNLHAAHADLPSEPSALSVPWVPLDPNVPLPDHFAQGRVPCTFPPKPADTMKNQKMSGTKAYTDTPNRREQVSMETNKDPLPTHPFRKRHGGAVQNKAVMRNIYRQANRGPNWQFWKKANMDKDEMT